MKEMSDLSSTVILLLNIKDLYFFINTRRLVFYLEKINIFLFLCTSRLCDTIQVLFPINVNIRSFVRQFLHGPTHSRLLTSSGYSG